MLLLAKKEYFPKQKDRLKRVGKKISSRHFRAKAGKTLVRKSPCLSCLTRSKRSSLLKMCHKTTKKHIIIDSRCQGLFRLSYPQFVNITKTGQIAGFCLYLKRLIDSKPLLPRGEPLAGAVLLGIKTDQFRF